MVEIFVDKFRKFKILVSPLAAFFLGTALTCCAYALLSSILGIRLSQNGVSNSNVGIILSLYYVGYVGAANSAYRIINRVGHIRAFTAFLSIFSSFTLLHYFSGNMYFWGILRLMEGYCIGSATMCLESWLNTRANNKNRGIIMSLYMVTTYMGAGMGQVLLNIPDPNGITIYILISILFSIALVPISLTALPTPDITVHENMPLKKLYQKTPVGVLGCFISGWMVGSFYTLGTVFSERIGLNIQETSMFMLFVILGGMIAQIPMGRLSDKMDRRKVMMGSCAALFFIAPTFKYLQPYGHLFIELGAIMIGFCMFVIYPICVSHVNDLVTDSERVQASGKLILLQGTGLITGPVVVGFVMDHFGSFSYLLCFSFVCCIFVLFTMRHMRIKPDIDYVSNTPTSPVPVEVTQAFEELATKDSLIERIMKSRKRKENIN
ncbi:MAG: MFS transporter [Lactobacillus sp.]|jgi:MFS family permease|nr:MFS transporter [Lactobacillus sp.]